MKIVNFFNAFILYVGLLMPFIAKAQPIQGSSSTQNPAGTAGVLGTSQIFNGVLGYTTANGHAGVAGACDEGMGNGVYGRSKNKNGVEGWSAAQAHSAVVGTNTGGGNGVLGVSNTGLGIYGKSEENSAIYGISKNKNGVEGWSAAKQHSAVVGTNTGGGNGVLGVSNQGLGVQGISVDDRGVYGQSMKTNGVLGVSKAQGHGGVAGIGANVGVYGKSEDPNGIAVWSDGKMTTKTIEILGGSDISEHFEVSENKTPIAAGTLMVIDEKNAGNVVPSALAYDKKVVGVVSGAGGVKTGMTLRQEGTLEGEAVIAVAGRVYVKVSTINGKIKAGDLLTSSNIAGYAMKATNKRKSNGAIIGKALTSLDAKDGLVLMLVNLQ